MASGGTSTSLPFQAKSGGPVTERANEMYCGRSSADRFLHVVVVKLLQFWQDFDLLGAR